MFSKGTQNKLHKESSGNERSTDRKAQKPVQMMSYITQMQKNIGNRALLQMLKAQTLTNQTDPAEESHAPIQRKGIESDDVDDPLKWAEIAMEFGDQFEELKMISDFVDKTIPKDKKEDLHSDMEVSTKLQTTDFGDEEADTYFEMIDSMKGTDKILEEAGLFNLVDELNSFILSSDDIAVVTEALAPFIPGIDEEAVAKIKTYLFDNAGITPNAANYIGWRRLSSGIGTVDDARFITHEFDELQNVDKASEEKGVPTTMERGEEGVEEWDEQNSEMYGKFHPQAFIPEYKFLADALKKLTKGQVDINYKDFAAADPTRPEARLQLLDKMTGPEYRDIHEKASGQSVELDSEARELLGLPLEGSLTLGQLVLHCKKTPLTALLKGDKKEDSLPIQQKSSDGSSEIHTNEAPIQRIAEPNLLEWQEQLATRGSLRDFEGMDDIWQDLEHFDYLNESEIGRENIKSKIESLNHALLLQNDIEDVRKTLSLAMGTNFPESDILALKRYNFDSDSSYFTAENYVAWIKLASGSATQDEIRYFVQQSAEMKALKESNIAFDFTKHHGKEESFSDYYDAAHHSGLCQEIEYLAEGIRGSYEKDVDWKQVAGSDEERREEFLPALAIELNMSISMPADLSALGIQLKDYHDPELRDQLTLFKSQSATGGNRSLVYEEGSIQNSPYQESHWKQCNYIMEETNEGPVWVHPDKKEELISISGKYDPGLQTHEAWKEKMENARENGDREQASMPSNGDVIGINESIPDRHSNGIHADYYDSALSMAARKATLAEKAAAIVHFIVANHMFNDGCKRTAFITLSKIITDNRGGRGLIGDPWPLLIKSATLKYSSSDDFAADLKALIPEAGINEPL